MEKLQREKISSLFEAMSELERKMANNWNSHNDLGFSKSHIFLLKFLAEEGPKRPSAIAEQLKVTTGGVTVLTTKLIKLGLIERVQSESDKRSAQIHITDSGMALLDQAKTHIEDLLMQMFGMLTLEEIETLKVIFDKCATHK
jgi:DNA-binding MarR family transcriptional regulator